MLTPAISASSTSEPCVIIVNAFCTQVTSPPFLKPLPLADEEMTTGLTPPFGAIDGRRLPERAPRQGRGQAGGGPGADQITAVHLAAYHRASSPSQVSGIGAKHSAPCDVIHPMSSTIRLATERDAEAIQRIYAPFVLRTAVSFETEPPSVDEMRSRILKILARLPWLVCESKGGVIGYAYASPHRERAAYGWSVNVTVCCPQKTTTAWGREGFVYFPARGAQAPGFLQRLRRNHSAESRQRRACTKRWVSRRRGLPRGGLQARPVA